MRNSAQRARLSQEDAALQSMRMVETPVRDGEWLAR
ncbi:MAG: hypothetical protein QOE20_4193, partial [Mycobacterium sp.]|nr:hypothetical protein [Mycobacterium sp.]